MKISLEFLAFRKNRGYIYNKIMISITIKDLI